MGNCCKGYDVITDNFEDTKLPIIPYTKVKVIKVYDGDTFWVTPGDKCRYSVRLYGVDCPEMKKGTAYEKSKAKEAKEFVINNILHKTIDINVLNNKMYKGKVQKEKYGRWLSIVHYNGKNLAEELIKNGHAKEYYGGKK
jgi:endonuclease YncB( thermonuclease family)